MTLGNIVAAGFVNKLTMLVALHALGHTDALKQQLDRLVSFSPIQEGLRAIIAGHNEHGMDICMCFCGCLVEPDESCDQHHSIITRWWFEICFHFHPYLEKIFNSTNICIQVQATTQSLFGTKSVDYVFSNFETLKVQFFASWTHSEKRVGRFFLQTWSDYSNFLLNGYLVP